MSSGIRDFVFDQAIFDGHEHLWTLPEFAKEQTYASICGYAGADLLVARGPRPPADENLPPVDKPEHKSAYFAAWRLARNTGYCRATERACRDLLGLEHTEENADAITAKLNALKGTDPVACYRDRKNLDRFALRDRKLTDVKIPSAVLRKGTNVLAIEVHRAPVAAVLLKDIYATWPPIGLLSLRLSASPGDAVVPNLGQPDGVHVGNCTPNRYLDERSEAFLRLRSGGGLLASSVGWVTCWVEQDQQDAKLMALAGEVAAAIGGKP